MKHTEQEDDPIIASLKKRYFDVVSNEDYPHTPKLTQEADNIERGIREMQKTKLKEK